MYTCQQRTVLSQKWKINEMNPVTFLAYCFESFWTVVQGGETLSLPPLQLIESTGLCLGLQDRASEKRELHREKTGNTQRVIFEYSAWYWSYEKLTEATHKNERTLPDTQIGPGIVPVPLSSTQIDWKISRYIGPWVGYTQSFALVMEISNRLSTASILPDKP